MVYGREIEGNELNFEASGALLNASLVMRDRETDSWWSIMTSDAIGGDLEGADLEELPVSEKMRWGDWVEKYPETKVLSVSGVEHVRNNPYDNYFESDDTFRGLEIEDDRMEPKEPVYVFWHEGTPYAISHDAFEGGAAFDLPGDRTIALHREEGASIFASSEAFLVPDSTVRDVLDRIERGETEGMSAVSGFDTWYSWVSVNPGTAVLD